MLKVIEDALLRKYDRIYLTYLDRLARFGTTPMLAVLTFMDIEVKTMHVAQNRGFEKQLVDDMLALVTSFAGKVHRRRRGKNKTPSNAPKLIGAA